MTTRADELVRLYKELRPLILGETQVSNIAMSAPYWERATLVGQMLQLDWSIVNGAAYYELWRNTSPSTSGATLLKTTAASQYISTLNQAAGELVSNGGFESGASLPAWRKEYLSNGDFEVVTSDKHSGVYSLKYTFAFPSGGSGGPSLLSDMIPITPSTAYVFSAWRKIVSFVGTHAAIIRLWWYDANQTYLSYSNLVTDNTTVASWTQATSTFTSPSNAAYVLILVGDLGGPFTSIEAYYDDFSLVGQAAIQQPTYYYAVRAFNQYGTAGPYSAWLSPTRAPSSLGTPDTPHLQSDYDAVAIRSSRVAEIAEAGGQLTGEDLRGGYMRAGRIAGWGPFAPGDDDAIARGLARDESDAVGWVVGDYAGNQYAYYSALLGLVISGELSATNGASATVTVVTDVANFAGALSKKTRSITITNGIITAVGAESAWTAI